MQAKEKSRKTKKTGYPVMPAQAKKGQTTIPNWLLDYQGSLVAVNEDERAKQIDSEPFRSGQTPDLEVIINGKKKLFSPLGKPLIGGKEGEYYMKDDDDLWYDDPRRYQQGFTTIQEEIDKDMEKAAREEVGITAEEKLRLLEERRKMRLQDEEEQLDKAIDLSKPYVVKRTEKDGVVTEEIIQESQYDPHDPQRKIRRTLIKKSRLHKPDQMNLGDETVYQDEEYIVELAGDDAHEIYLNEEEGKDITARTAGRKRHVIKMRTKKPGDPEDEALEIEEEFDVESAELSAEETEARKSYEPEVPLFMLTPEINKIDKPGQPTKLEIQTILKPRAIESEDVSIFITQEKEKEVVPTVKNASKARDEHPSFK